MLTCKVVLVGSSGVGKTELVERIKGEPFVPGRSRERTIGANLSHKGCLNFDVKLDLWDLGGDPRYTYFLSMFLSESHCVAFVYNPDMPDSFEDVKLRFAKVSLLLSRYGVRCILVEHSFTLLNDDDNSDTSVTRKGVVDRHQAREFAESNNMAFLQVSAQSGEGIEALESMVCREFLEREDIRDQLNQARTPGEFSRINNSRICRHIPIGTVKTFDYTSLGKQILVAMDEMPKHKDTLLKIRTFLLELNKSSSERTVETTVETTVMTILREEFDKDLLSIPGNRSITFIMLGVAGFLVGMATIALAIASGLVGVAIVTKIAQFYMIAYGSFLAVIGASLSYIGRESALIHDIKQHVRRHPLSSDCVSARHSPESGVHLDVQAGPRPFETSFSS